MGSEYYIPSILFLYILANYIPACRASQQAGYKSSQNLSTLEMLSSAAIN